MGAGMSRSLKKVGKPNRDDWRAVIVVARESEITAWQRSADRRGLSTSNWIRDLMGRIVVRTEP